MHFYYMNIIVITQNTLLTVAVIHCILFVCSIPRSRKKWMLPLMTIPWNTNVWHRVNEICKSFKDFLVHCYRNPVCRTIAHEFKIWDTSINAHGWNYPLYLWFGHLATTTQFNTTQPIEVHTERPENAPKVEIYTSLNGTSHQNAGKMNITFLFIVKGCHIIHHPMWALCRSKCDIMYI